MGTWVNLKLGPFSMADSKNDIDPTIMTLFRESDKKLYKGTVKELESKTGYSSRWLNMKFKDKLGVSPKNLSSIVRFNQYYQSFILGSEESLFKNDFHQLYYDQSHLIKDFKRFTGLPPTKLEKHINDFSKSYFIK